MKAAMELATVGDRIDWLVSMLFESRYFACHTFGVESYSTMIRWIDNVRLPRGETIIAMLDYGISANWVMKNIGPVVVDTPEGRELHDSLTAIIMERQPMIVPTEYRHLVTGRPSGPKKGKTRKTSDDATPKRKAPGRKRNL